MKHVGIITGWNYTFSLKGRVDCIFLECGGAIIIPLYAIYTFLAA
jgi:hypothetical protein